MINLKEFLLTNNIKGGTYALVTYNNRTEPTWFTRYNFGNGDWFLESPCILYRLMEVNEPIDDFCKKYMEECIVLEEGESEENYITEFVKPMIVDGWLYEIENFQCFPYLPKEIEDIELISERECLNYMLKNNNKG